MIKWYESKNLVVYFSAIPEIKTKVITPMMDDEKIEEIVDKPLVLKNKILCKIKANGKVFIFKIPVGYEWDGATIPEWCWSIIGSSLEPDFLVASLIHDVLCENHDYVGYNRNLSTKVFVALLKVAKVGKFKRWLMYHIVDNYQKFLWRSKND